jgi:curved DNA-binding protein CbpA
MQSQPERSHWSYEYLGCTEHDTDDTIKRAYRRLAVKLHPDKHASHALSPEQTLSHLRAFQKLQQAYEAIWRLRGASAS